jgi:hypothetical protein
VNEHGITLTLTVLVLPFLSLIVIVALPQVAPAVTVIFVEKIEAFCGTVGVTVDGLDGAVRTPDGARERERGDSL